MVESRNTSSIRGVKFIESIKKYDPAVIWLDGDWADWWTLPDGIASYRAIRAESPRAIVNNRVAKRGSFEADFFT